MTDEMGDTWRRTGTVDIKEKSTYDKIFAKIRKKKERFERFPFLFRIESDAVDKETST